MATREDEQKLIEQTGQAQLEKLDRRSEKGRMGWRYKTIVELFDLLDDEVDELDEAIEERTPEKIAEEATDVINSAMFIRDQAMRGKL